MKKTFFGILLILLILVKFYAEDLNILNSFSLNFSNIKMNNSSVSLYYNEDNNFLVILGYDFKFNNNFYNMYVYLKPIKNKSLQEIKKFTKIQEEEFGNNSFGMGDIYKFFHEEKNIIPLTNKDNITIRKYISDWGTEVSRDILAYNFELKNNPIFNNCIIEFYDIWGEKGEQLPNNFNTKFVEEEIKKGNKKTKLYKIIDDIISNISFLNSNEATVNKKVLTPTISNLRFRETPDLKGKFIRSLKQGEKLELIEKGKTETINGTKGTWVKVKTEKGEIGWCFDAYLDEVKKK